MKKVYFLCDFKTSETKRKLNCSISAMSYSQYIKDSLKNAGLNVIILSTASAITESYSSIEIHEIDNQEKHIYFPSFKKVNNKLLFYMRLLYMYACIIRFLISNSTREDVILVYHNNSLSYFYKIIKVFCKGEIAFVVGEIYSAVFGKNEKKILSEKNRLSVAHKFIFPNDIMPELFKKEKDCAVCYGNYHVHDIKVNQNEGINIVYAGKIDRKYVTDAFLALDTIALLDKRYQLRIIGYGEQEDVECLKKKIEELNIKKGYESVRYDGCLTGVELDDYLGACHIGLCTRVLNEEISNYCFPSKTLTYLTHGLLPICPTLSNLTRSKIAPALCFVEQPLTANKLAITILNLPSDFKNSEEFLLDLDREFIVQLKSLFLS